MSNLPAPTTRDLFTGVPIQKAFAAQRARALADVAALTPELLLAGDLWRLQTQLLETYRLRPLRLDWDARRAEACILAENDRDTPKTTVCVFVPFSGTPGLFDMSPTRRGGQHPAACIRPDEIVLVITVGHADASREFARQVELINEWTALINGDVDGFNRELAATLRTRLASRARRARRSADLALDLGPPRQRSRATRADDRRPTSARVASGARRAITPTRHGPGRPRWPDDLLADRYEEAVAGTSHPRTVEAIAAHFRPLNGQDVGVTADHLRRLLRRIEPRRR